MPRTCCCPQQGCQKRSTSTEDVQRWPKGQREELLEDGLCPSPGHTSLRAGTYRARLGWGGGPWGGHGELRWEARSAVTGPALPGTLSTQGHIPQKERLEDQLRGETGSKDQKSQQRPASPSRRPDSDLEVSVLGSPAPQLGPRPPGRCLQSYGGPRGSSAAGFWEGTSPRQQLDQSRAWTTQPGHNPPGGGRARAEEGAGPVVTGTPALMPEACRMHSQPSHHKAWGASDCCRCTTWTERLLGTRKAS
ncbi:translation initiation factor IF-2-like isoform X1 [Herpailurus yagouaroundi]|uniref:translation initiation factor IF-2-like isoform X1 n=1 Tax=Herpailurus yagouaroundi TaxID=1608482 RepID=UPI001AD74D91|nr:translation initiation factor IF-2-like isoform X1 [Puma yagouaroundi]